MLNHAYDISPDSQWFIIINDRSFVFMDNLAQVLAQLNPFVPLFLGHTTRTGENMKVDPQFWVPESKAGIAISRKLASLLFDAKRSALDIEWVEVSRNSPSAACALADFIWKKLRIEMCTTDTFTMGPLFEIEIDKSRWCQPLSIVGNVTSQDYETLFKYDRLMKIKSIPITYSAIYQNFYQLYVARKRGHWYNGADEFKAFHSKTTTNGSFVPRTLKHESTIRNYGECREMCDRSPLCLSWVYKPGNGTGSQCGIATYLRLGRSTKHRHADSTKFTTSGWMISRIQNISTYSDCSEYRTGSEGWFLFDHGTTELDAIL
jgi:hypothetical protein